MTTRLEAIRQRVQAATKGSWTWTEGFLWNVASDEGVLNHKADWDVTEEDEAFISHSREDIPLLLAVVDSLKKDVAWEDARRAGNPMEPMRIGRTTRERLAALDVEEQP